MKSFFILTKRKTFELILLLVFDLVFYVLWNSWDFLVFFSFGYIWNWVASQENSLSFENRRYRFSTLKTVINLQHLFLKPLVNMPKPVKFLGNILPAGIFWSLVVLFNESHTPWWAVFIGSACLELLLLETKLFKPQVSSL